MAPTEFIGGRGAIRAVMQDRTLRAAGGLARKVRVFVCLVCKCQCESVCVCCVVWAYVKECACV
jgi:hypothetical protein